MDGVMLEMHSLVFTAGRREGGGDGGGDDDVRSQDIRVSMWVVVMVVLLVGVIVYNP